MKKPYAESTLKRKYRETGIDPVRIEDAQLLLTACARFYKLIEVKDIWKIISKHYSTTKDEILRLLPIFERDDNLEFYVARDDELYSDGTDALLLIDKDYITIPNDEATDVDIAAWVQQGADYAGPPLIKEDFEIIYMLNEERQGKPLFIPADLIFYADPDYIEETPQVAAMRQFLSSGIKMNPKKVLGPLLSKYSPQEQRERMITAVLLEMHDLICDVKFCEENDPASAAVDVLEDSGFRFSDQKQLQRFIALFSDLNNNTRLPCHRGFTPIELHRKYDGSLPQSISSDSGMQKKIHEGPVNRNESKQVSAEDQMIPSSLRSGMTSEIGCAMQPGEVKWINGTIIKGEKIRPNDPCPCGSGKKYKKCCGKPT